MTSDEQGICQDAAWSLENGELLSPRAAAKS